MTGARRAPSGPLPRMARLAPRVRCRIRRRARQAMAAITAEAPAERYRAVRRARRRSPHVADQQKNKNDLQRRASARNARSAVVLIHKAARANRRAVPSRSTTCRDGECGRASCRPSTRARCPERSASSLASRLRSAPASRRRHRECRICAS
ncbi:uncharacterized protein BCN122_I1388 [Burkholderia cenocepacia]|nr:uncharacterized protein BCN122_I1388 [Burkholderia cenocepacia]